MKKQVRRSLLACFYCISLFELASIEFIDIV
jgi:hypothetical protein